MSRVAIIQFPGSNCERETLAAVLAEGLEGEIVRSSISVSEFETFDAYILPGGFSYQDRVRAGAIASKLSLIGHLNAASQAGKPILGICNGCQILAESGLVPHIAMGANRDGDSGVGFICDWVKVRVKNPEQNVFTRLFSSDLVLPIPINHGEGQFIFADGHSYNENGAIFQYCDDDGVIRSEFPYNPNGSAHNLAGLGNAAGNVFAMMPHPERASFQKQIPDYVQGNAMAESADGPFSLVFRSLKEVLS